MKHLVIALAYFDNPEMLREQHRVIETYPEHVRAVTKLIVVDDCSERAPADAAVFGGAYTPSYEREIYRIKEPQNWGQLRARNLCMHVAPAGSWVLATDIDHVLPAASAEKLLAFEPQQGWYYTFERRLAGSLAPLHPHPNSYLMNREWFWNEVGGCNEDYVGWYGTDCIFRRRAAMFGHARQLPVELHVYNMNGEDVGGVPNSGTNLPRKKSKYHIRRCEALKGAFKTAHLRRPENPLRFSWSRVR